MAKRKSDGKAKPESSGVTVAALEKLAVGPAFLAIDRVDAGYGRMPVLHDLSLRLAQGQSLCLVGPNGSGKSTVLNAIYGFAKIFQGDVTLGGSDIAALDPSAKLKAARLAYVLQKDSVFPDMTVEENLWMGGFLLESPADAKAAATAVLDRYPKLKARAREKARVLSGGERRLLEITRALIMDPQILLIDEPSVGLEPRAIRMIFETLSELRDDHRKTLLLVEQNAHKGLEFAEIGYVLVAGKVVRAGRGKELLDDPEMRRLFLGG